MLYVVVADSLVYIALILLNLQFPAWLFPCLLYVQVICDLCGDREGYLLIFTIPQILPFIADHFPPTFGASYHAVSCKTEVFQYSMTDLCLIV